MGTFVYKAMDPTGIQSRGEVEAESAKAVTSQLKGRGLIVLEVTSKTKSKELELPFVNRIKPHDLTVATRQLSAMVSSGMTILRALFVLEEQTANKKLRAVWVAVRKDVEAGQSLSDALERHPKVFNPLYVAMVRAGETGGLLEETLMQVADQLEKEDSLRRQVKSAMMYPLVIVTFACMTLIALVAYVVPIFVKVFKQFGGDLPLITRITIGISNLVTQRWYVVIAVVSVTVYGVRRWKSSPRGRRQWDRLRLRIPARIGEIVQKVALARWSRTLSALVEAGVPILAAIEITGKTAGNQVVEEAMVGVHDSVKRGGTIGAPLREAPIFPHMVSHMVGVGEETGALGGMLSKIADFYEDEVNAAVKSLTSILEPVMIVLVGAIVGFIVISMYLPLFKVYDSIK